MTNPFAILDGLRADGWAVAVHNDYWLAGERRTFWLMTHRNGRWIKGEAETDLGALLECRHQAEKRREITLTALSQTPNPAVPISDAPASD